MWNNISVHLDCLVIGLHVCGIGRYFQIWWKIKNGIIFLELRFWYGTLEFFQLPFLLTPNTILRVHQSWANSDMTSDTDSDTRYSRTTGEFAHDSRTLLLTLKLTIYFSHHIELGRLLIKSQKCELRLRIGTVINLWGDDLGSLVPLRSREGLSSLFVSWSESHHFVN